MKPILAFVITLVCAVSASAITIDTVPVGDVGNANDPATGNLYGGVNYAYNIGKYEVTVGQYAAFLNAVAATDTYNLYIELSFQSQARITRSGASGTYSYSVLGSGSIPVWVTDLGIVARFANWLHNGQPTGMQVTNTTEDGAYTLNGATSYEVLLAVTRNPGAKWFLPTENEWYKAAYYQPAEKGGDADNYWKYPMRTNSPPYSDQPPGATPDNTRVGNFYKNDGVANGYDDGYALSNCGLGCPTDAGAYTSAPSYYGTFDQGGNVWELNETIIPFAHSWGFRGGSWRNGVSHLEPSVRIYFDDLASAVGFRVATVVPEPSTLLLTITGFAAFLIRHRKSVSHGHEYQSPMDRIEFDTLRLSCSERQVMHANHTQPA